jgi:DNA-binding transcriptional LysR family regulator
VKLKSASRGKADIDFGALRHRMTAKVKMHGSDALGWSRVLGRSNQQLDGVRDVFRCDDFEALREAALSGFGIALLPSWVVGQDIAAGSLKRLLPTAVDAIGEAGGVYVLRALAEPPAKVTAFTASLRTVVGSPPIWDRVNEKAKSSFSER